jgi:hypothetical protein
MWCNNQLQQAYHFRLQEMEGLRRNGPPCNCVDLLKHLKFPHDAREIDLNEVLLMHGACDFVVDKICKGGFDPKRGGEGAGKRFGVATYLTPNASKADMYTDPDMKKNRAGKRALRKIIIVRAAMGMSYETHTPMQKANKAPDGPDGEPYDSVWAADMSRGGCVHNMEVMIYEKHQALPIAIVEYFHREGCLCSECPKRPDV